MRKFHVQGKRREIRAVHARSCMSPLFKTRRPQYGKLSGCLCEKYSTLEFSVSLTLPSLGDCFHGRTKCVSMADENENEEKEPYFSPSYGCDERKKDGYMYVIVEIQGLKTSTDIVFKGIIPKKVKKAENAKIDVMFENQSFCVTVDGERGDLKWQKLRLKIKRLPLEIVPDQSYYEVDKNRVLLYLCKKEDRAWIPLFKDGLETAEEEEVEDQ